MKRFLLFFCIAILAVAGVSQTAFAYVWVDANNLDNADVKNNVTTYGDKIVPATGDTETVLYSTTTKSYGEFGYAGVGNWVTGFEVAQMCNHDGGCNVTITTGEGDTLVSAKIPDTDGAYWTFYYPLNHYVTSNIVYNCWCDGCSASVKYHQDKTWYGYPALPNPYVELHLTKSDLQKGGYVYFDGTEVTVQLLKADGTVLDSSVTDGQDISGYYYMLQDYDYPLRIKASFPTDGNLKYLAVAPNGIAVYADEEGLHVEAVEYASYSAPAVNTSDVVSGYGNITLYVYKNGQPLQNAKIKVTNALGYSYITSTVTESEGRIDIVGLDSKANWDENMQYTFEVLDLSLNPILDDLGNPLNITVDFISGVAQTNPAIIYTSTGIATEYAAFTDSEGVAVLQTGVDKLLRVIITKNGETIYDEMVISPYVVDIRTGGGTGGDEGGEEETEEEYGNPDSKYVVILDKYTAKINEPIIVKVRNTQKAWWNPFDPEWVEGAEIYFGWNSNGEEDKRP